LGESGLGLPIIRELSRSDRPSDAAWGNSELEGRYRFDTEASTIQGSKALGIRARLLLCVCGANVFDSRFEIGTNSEVAVAVDDKPSLFRVRPENQLLVGVGFLIVGKIYFQTKILRVSPYSRRHEEGVGCHRRELQPLQPFAKVGLQFMP